MSTITGNFSVIESELDRKKKALEFAQKEVDELLKRGDIKEPKKKTDRELGINTVAGGRYIRAFTKLSNLDFFEKAVLLNLASRLDFRGLDTNGFFQDEVRFVTQEQLAEDLSLSERKIRDVLSSLNKKKFIEKKNHYNFEKKCRSVNSYSITEHAFIECFNTLKKQNDEKYNEYLEELERAKQYYIEMYLSSQRIQYIHDLPAQYAGSDFLYKNQAAQYAGWIGTICRQYRHNMPIFSFLIFPLHISPFLVCVDSVQTKVFTHSKKEKPKEAENGILPTLETKLYTKEENVLKNETRVPKKKEENGIPMNMRRKLSDILRDILNRDFVDNDDCKMIIETVTLNTNKSIEEFRLMMIDLPNYDPSLIFNPKLILKDRRIRKDLNAMEVAKNLERWITSKDAIILEYETAKREFEELENKRKLDAVAFLAKEEEERKKREILKLENERILKEKDQQDFEKLPQDFKEWFQTLSLYNKKEFRKQIRKLGPECFSKEVLPAIIEYQNYCNKNQMHFKGSQSIVI